MRQTTVHSFEELHSALAGHRRGRLWIYRGQPAEHWPLVPKVGRRRELVDAEADLFAAWKRSAVQYVAAPPPTDWEWLAIAQHHGLATRLLDWTGNPLVAAFFASCQDKGGDAVVWAFSPDQAAFGQSPLEYRGIGLYRPGAHAARIARQGAAFTVHGPPDIEIDDQHGDLHELVIAAEYRSRLLGELQHYGYTHATLFPDLDGLSRFLNWMAVTGRLGEEKLAENGTGRPSPESRPA